MVLAVLTTMFQVALPINAASLVEEVDVERNGEVEVEFREDVKYNNLKVTVKDANGKSVAINVIEVDEDGVEFKLTSFTQGAKYTFEISGITVLSTNKKTSVTGSFKMPGTAQNTTTQKPKWVRNGNVWTYRLSDGSLAKGWKKISGDWYYFNSRGEMQTGWLKLGNKWYYLDDDGEMETGWEKIRGKYYYFNQSGVMQANKWIGRYHVNASGVWDRTR